jgi:choloylglycine hydrolase
MNQLFERFIVAGALFLLGTSIGFAWTDIRLVAQDGTVMIGRTLEFAEQANSNLISSARQKAFKSTAANGKAGLSWDAKYGYVFIDGFNMGVPMDGMNEEGLSIEALYLPGIAEYQTVPEGKEQQALPYYNFGDWVLGNFKTVEEVRKALPDVYVYAATLPQFKDFVFPLHFAIHDASGKGIVVEYVKGELTIYDNEIGVLTNSPTYDWHITNLRNYVNLTPTTPKPIIVDGMTFAATGQGAGMVGLPGDISPPSRFVKMAVMLKTVIQPKNATEALNLSQHIINNVDIPLGFVREAQQENTATNELTQWTVFKDLTNKKFYYRTYDDLTLRSVDLAKIDFSANAQPLKMPIASEQYIVDMTQQFTGKK